MKEFLNGVKYLYNNKITSMEYTVDYFIEKFSNIHKSKWTIGIFRSHIVGSQDVCCALGHCGVEDDLNTAESFALKQLFKHLNVTSHLHPDQEVIDPIDINRISWKVPIINDGRAAEYRQNHPKDRILAALYNIKAMRESTKAVEEILMQELQTV